MVAPAQIGAIERMMQTASGQMNREAAEAILRWHFAESDQAKVAELSAKARRGELTSEEAAELDWYLLLGDFLSIVQSRARIGLANAPATR